MILLYLHQAQNISSTLSDHSLIARASLSQWNLYIAARTNMRTHLLPSLATSESAMIESVDLTSGNCQHQRVSRRLLNQFALNGNILGLDEDIDVRFFFGNRVRWQK